MPQPRLLRIYLERHELKRARDGGYNVMTRIKEGFEWAGFRVEFTRDSEEERLKSLKRRGYALFHMQEPHGERTLNLRKAYYFPFWRIERTNRRWEFDVARADYDSSELEPVFDPEWAMRWRKWLFAGKAADPVREGVVYVPLQGMLTQHRSFQTMSPMDMITEVIAREPEKRIVLGLHPNETYGPETMRLLQGLEAGSSRISLCKGGAEELLRICDYVVTQNSSVALSGFFFHKPAILFGKIDFHHIALNVAGLGVDEAFARVPEHRPEYDRYLHWFIQLNAIKADEHDAHTRFVDRCRALGWDIPPD